MGFSKASIDLRGEFMGKYIRLVDYSSQHEKEEAFLKLQRNGTEVYTYLQERFQEIPQCPYIYWFSDKMKSAYKNGVCLCEIAEPKAGLATGNNEIFQRCWYEVDFCKIGFGIRNTEETITSGHRWYPCNSGGFFRKWYPFNLYVVNWEDDGKLIKQYKNSKGKLAARPQNTEFYFREGLTWNKISSKRFAVQFKEIGSIFDDTSRSAFVQNEHLYFVIGLLCSKVSLEFLNGLNPTMSYTNGDISRIPISKKDLEKGDMVKELVKECIELSRSEYINMETSWLFECNSLLKGNKMGKLISEKFEIWVTECDNRFRKIKSNETEINKYFIATYGLENEISAEVTDSEITISKPNLEREIKSLISYVVGCIMGRYSIKEDGLIYAGGEWDNTRYSEEFKPCEYGIMPITEEQYFEEDLCTRVIDFIKVVYGEDTLTENLKFIASALKPGSFDAPKKIIREYLFNGFFDNHYQIYQHRPIYWQLDSGKAGGFRAIVYMHRYSENTLPIVRTEYIQELRYKYEEEMQRLQHRAVDATTMAEKNAIRKEITAIDKKLVECTAYDDLLNHATSNIQNYTFDLDDGVKTNYAKFLSVDGDKSKNILTVIKL